MNIIFLLSDTFRYDNLLERAAVPVRTPNLDRFLQRAVSVENFYTGSFPTIPQRTDLISGRIGWPRHGWQHIEKSTTNLLPAVLREKGYVSQLICDCPHLFKTGFNLVFDAAHALRGQEGDVHFLRMNDKIHQAMPPEKTRTSRHFKDRYLIDLHTWQNAAAVCEEDKFAARTARKTVQWLEHNYRQGPFFLWVDFFDPHEPWDPPEYMVPKYNPGYSGAPMLHPNYGRADDYTPEELANLRAHYCAESELVDRWIGRIFEKLTDLGLWDNSIVVFSTDHGINLGEHNRTGKSNANDSDSRRWPIYPETAHIPFLISAPGLQGGRSVQTLGQPADIIPTIMELADIQAEFPEELHGCSLTRSLRTGSDHSERELVVSALHPPLDNKGNLPAQNATTPAVYTREWCWIPAGETGPELYRLPEDPGATTNMAAENMDVIRELSKKVLSWLAEVSAPENLKPIFSAG